MAIVDEKGLDVPYRDPIAMPGGSLSFRWETFFKNLRQLIGHMSFEKSFEFENNISVAKDVVGLQFDSSKVNQVTIDYFIQRVQATMGTPVEYFEAGSLIAVYGHFSGAWSIFYPGDIGPDTSGIVFSITPGGQVQYTSTNLADAVPVNKVTYRTRTLAAKLHASYPGIL